MKKKIIITVQSDQYLSIYLSIISIYTTQHNLSLI